MKVSSSQVSRGPDTGNEVLKAPISEEQFFSANADDILLDITTAAKFLNVSVNTLHNWRHKGRGPAFVRLSKSYVRYRRRDLMAFIESKLRRSTSDPGPGQKAI